MPNNKLREDVKIAVEADSQEEYDAVASAILGDNYKFFDQDFTDSAEKEDNSGNECPKMECPEMGYDEDFETEEVKDVEEFDEDLYGSTKRFSSPPGYDMVILKAIEKYSK